MRYSVYCLLFLFTFFLFCRYQSTARGAKYRFARVPLLFLSHRMYAAHDVLLSVVFVRRCFSLGRCIFGRHTNSAFSLDFIAYCVPCALTFPYTHFSFMSTTCSCLAVVNCAFSWMMFVEIILALGHRVFRQLNIRNLWCNIIDWWS